MHARLHARNLFALLALLSCTYVHALGESWVARSFSLRQLGLSQDITLNQKNRERHFYFPIAQNAVVTDAYVELDATYLRQFPGIDGLTVLINGVPINAQSLEPGVLPSFLKMTGMDGKPVSGSATDSVSEKIHLSIPLIDLNPNSHFVDVSLSFNSQNDVERCTDITGRGNELQIDADSRIHYRYDRNSVVDVRSFLTALPSKARILLPDQPGVTQYETALRLLMGLRNQGINPQVWHLPKIGDTVATDHLVLQKTLANAPMFQTLSSAIEQKQKFNLASEQDMAAWIALTLLSDGGLADLVIDPGGLRAALVKAAQVWHDQGVLPLFPLTIRQAVAWAIQPPTGKTNLDLVNWDGAQMLVIDAFNQTSAALLTGSYWTAIANGSALGVAQASPIKIESTTHRLMIAQNLPSQYLQGTVHWDVPFHAKELPNGERPNSLQLNIMSAHRTGDTPAVVSVFMNDYLITAKDLRGDGEITAVNAFVPLYTLKADNVLRIEVVDTAQKSCAGSRALPVQILPSSFLGLGGANDVKEFFSLVPQLSRDSSVIIPAAYLQHADDTLLTVSRILQGLAMTAEGYKVVFAGSNEFEAHGPFVSFGVQPKNLSGLVDTQLDKLVIRNKDQAVIFDSKGLGSLAVVQIVAGQGVLVSRVGKDDLNLQMPLDLSTGNLVIMDGQGVKLTLNTNDPNEEFSLNESGRGLVYLIERFHLPFVIVSAVLFIALLLLTIRLALKARRRRADRLAAEKSKN